jgi:hypothetical protein
LQPIKASHISKISAAQALIAILAFAAAPVLVSPTPAAESAALYRISKSVTLGAPERWDYLTFEPISHRVYLAHGDKIEVFDAQSETIVGRVASTAPMASRSFRQPARAMPAAAAASRWSCST